MFWWILLGICSVITIMFIIFAVIDLDYDGEFWGLISTLTGFVTLILVMIVILVPASEKQKIEEFKRQKYYIEVITKELPNTDNYALTLKRIELNEWLYNAQYEYENYRFFTFLPSEVMELEEIK